jgi:hypothetical protein
MLASRTSDFSDLVALRFRDRETFYLATDILSQYGIRADALGGYTLLIHKRDEKYLADMTKDYETREVVTERTSANGNGGRGRH